jgi:hypothetical protein
MEGPPMSADKLVIATTNGRDELCSVIWSDADKPHVVAVTPTNRTIIAKRKLGAWSEVALQTIAARLNRSL